MGPNNFLTDLLCLKITNLKTVIVMPFLKKRTSRDEYALESANSVFSQNNSIIDSEDVVISFVIVIVFGILLMIC